MNCAICKQPLKMHYEPWCPKCWVPQPENMKIMDLTRVLAYLREQGIVIPDGFYNHIADNFNGSDSLGYIPEPDDLDEDDEEEYQFIRIFEELWNTVDMANIAREDCHWMLR